MLLGILSILLFLSEENNNMEFSLLKRLSQQYTQIIYGPLLPQMNPKDVNYTKLLLLESTILLSTVC